MSKERSRNIIRGHLISHVLKKGSKETKSSGEESKDSSRPKRHWGEATNKLQKRRRPGEQRPGDQNQKWTKQPPGPPSHRHGSPDSRVTESSRVQSASNGSGVAHDRSSPGRPSTSSSAYAATSPRTPRPKYRPDTPVCSSRHSPLGESKDTKDSSKSKRHWTGVTDMLKLRRHEDHNIRGSNIVQRSSSPSRSVGSGGSDKAESLMSRQDDPETSIGIRPHQAPSIRSTASSAASSVNRGVVSPHARVARVQWVSSDLQRVDTIRDDHSFDEESPQSSVHSSIHSPLRTPLASPTSSIASGSIRSGNVTPRRQDSTDSISSHSSLNPRPDNSIKGHFSTSRRKRSKNEENSGEETRFKRRMQRVDRIVERAKKTFPEYAFPITLDAATILFRGARFGPPVGAVIACAAGVVHFAVEALHEIRLNGQSADELLEYCVDEVETCWDTVYRGSSSKVDEVTSEVYDAIKEDMTKVIEHCKKTQDLARKYKDMKFIKRFIQREEIKRQISKLTSSLSWRTDNLKFFIIVRCFTVIKELKYQNQRNHREVMHRFDQLQDGLAHISEKIDRLSSDNVKGLSRDAAAQTDSGRLMDKWVKGNRDEAIESTVEYAKKLKDRDYEAFKSNLEKDAQAQEKVRKIEMDKGRNEGEIKEVKNKLEEIQHVRNAGVPAEEIHREILTILEIGEGDIAQSIEELEKKKKNISDELSRLDANSSNPEVYKLEENNLLLQQRLADEVIGALRVQYKGKYTNRNSSASVPRIGSGEDLVHIPMHNRKERSPHSRDASVVSSRRESAVSSRRSSTPQTDSPTTTQQFKPFSSELQEEGSHHKRHRKPQTVSAGVQVDVGELIGRRHLTPMPLNRDARLFAEKLVHKYDASLRQPLWTPEKCALGDVGFIDEEGSFVCLFNAFTGNKESRKIDIPRLDPIAEVPGKRDVVGGKVMLRSRMAVAREERTAGEIRARFKRYCKMENFTGYGVAFMYLEKTRHLYLADLRKPRAWFQEHALKILKHFGERYERLHKENIILVTGKLETPDYAFLINHSAPEKVEKWIRFYVHAERKVGQPWGFFARDAQPRPEDYKSRNVRHVAKLRDSEASQQVSLVRRDNDWYTALLARLHFKVQKDERGKETLRLIWP